MLAEKLALGSSPCLPLVKDGFTSLSRRSYLKLLFIAQAEFLPFILCGSRRSDDDKLRIMISPDPYCELYWVPRLPRTVSYAGFLACPTL